MTTDEAQKVFDHMVEIFGDSLPNMEQEPLRFEYYVKMYQYYYYGKEKPPKKKKEKPLTSTD